MKHRLLLSFAALMIFAGLGHTAFADSLTITFANANQSSAPGGNPLYSAVLTNTTGSTLFLNGDSFSFASSFTPTIAPSLQMLRSHSMPDKAQCSLVSLMFRCPLAP